MKEKIKTRLCKNCSKPFSIEFLIKSRLYCSDRSCKLDRNRKASKASRNRIKEHCSISDTYNIRQSYYSYRYRCPKRGLEFDLKYEEFEKAYEAPCYFCNDTFDSVGFSRKDMSKGYTKDNVVPSCKQCNFHKKNKNINEFLEWCKKIADNHSILRE